MNKTMKIILENQLCANTEVHFFIKPGFDTNFNNVTIWTNIDHNNVTVWTNNDHCNFAVPPPPPPPTPQKKKNQKKQFSIHFQVYVNDTTSGNGNFKSNLSKMRTENVFLYTHDKTQQKQK